jgi:hypothetical protein
MNCPEICNSFRVPLMNEKNHSFLLVFETTRTESSSILKINYTNFFENKINLKIKNKIGSIFERWVI